MKVLKDIIAAVTVIKIIGDDQKSIKNLCMDSREVEKNSLFIAIEGTQTDGHYYIEKAINLGATAVICEKLPDTLDSEVTYIQVADSSVAVALAANTFYDYPSKKLKLVGITGTNGKTTIVTLLHQLYSDLGYKVGMLSTVKNMIAYRVIPATHTTPNPIMLNYLLSKMVEEGCEFCFMEVSSHAIVQHRILGLSFTGGAFTNLTHDHLDFHKTLKDYIEAKKAFFDQLPESAFALTNIDDKNGEVMLQNTKAKKKSYALKQMADFKSKILENSFSGLYLDIAQQKVYFKLIGEFNAYNITCVFGIATLLGTEKLEILKALSQLRGAEGRFDFINSRSSVKGIVDYAHTPDALENIINTLQNTKKGGTLITIIGCGGDRDKSKRALMGQIAVTLSDKVIFTSDNPRSEDPADIIKDMESEVYTLSLRRKYFVIVDRKEAIHAAAHMATGDDIILLAGKGHEKYQEINGVKNPFDDKEILTHILNQIA